LIDLGVWLEEGYAIPGPELAEESSPDERVSPGG
jgi:endogenous inhibitor of DNA gyrase (YacG/DUF329 family)